MLTSDEISLLCQRLEISSQAQAVLATIRSSPPLHCVGSGGKNVSVRYPSRKIGVIVQVESCTNATSKS
jgi:putative transposase